MTWNWTYVGQFLPQLLRAIPTTLEATVLSSLLALVFGLLLAMMKRSDRLIISGPITAASEAVRRTPVLVQLYFVFYVFPTFGITLSAMAAGVITLGVHYGTYTAETYRAGIDAVPQGQWDAARALDMPRRRIWTKVILPQALPKIAAAQGSWVILLFKQTALLSAITVQEMLSVSQQIGSTHFDYLEPTILVGVFYLVISYPAGVAVRYYERRVAHA
ncbi:MAG TPA: ectoine/hydroxyectoine ABC transporter permease subunit EhuD [Solirubrobacteraceae bacterium]|nr:ectoine/hydroxyectoine ABC transporter permease subunit EhuD [Solirubrobacteraceae bacterium]